VRRRTRAPRHIRPFLSPEDEFAAFAFLDRRNSGGSQAKRRPMLLPAGWTLNVANTWYTNGIGAPFSQ
jgi:hypothetical protein